jgi:hypothetical protein
MHDPSASRIAEIAVMHWTTILFKKKEILSLVMCIFYVKWNKPGTERQKMHYLFYVWVVQKWNSYKQSKMVVTRG